MKHPYLKESDSGAMTSSELTTGATPTSNGAVSAGSEADSLRILWVKVGGLWPLNTGGRLRSFHIVRELSHRHQLSLITSHAPQEDGAALSRQLPHCRQVISVPHTPAKHNSPRFLLALMRSWLTPLPVDIYKNHIAALEREVQRALNSGNYDLCVADFLTAMPNVPLDGDTPLLFFSHNVEHMIWRRLGNTETRPLHRALLALEWRKMRRYETASCRRAGLSIAVSEKDKRMLGASAPGSRMRAIPTGVDLDYFHPGDAARQQPLEIVFSGSMDWHPNEDAILYFIDAMLPRLRRELPQLSVTVVGRNPSRRLQEAAVVANVRLTGTVDDVRPYIERAAVYVVPLRIGGGTRLKIYEALAMGKAVVSTRIGAEGLPLKDGKHLLLADDPAEFAEKILALLRDPDRRRQLGEAGRRLMELRYSWPRVARVFERHCRELLE